MAIEVSCRCGKRFAAETHLAGQQVPCPDCQRPITIPELPPLVVACVCGKAFAAQGHLAGQEVPCPQCGQILQVPTHPARSHVQTGGLPVGRPRVDALGQPVATEYYEAEEELLGEPPRPAHEQVLERARKEIEEDHRRHRGSSAAGSIRFLIQWHYTGSIVFIVLYMADALSPGAEDIAMPVIISCAIQMVLAIIVLGIADLSLPGADVFVFVLAILYIPAFIFLIWAYALIAAFLAGFMVGAMQSGF